VNVCRHENSETLKHPWVVYDGVVFIGLFANEETARRVAELWDRHGSEDLPTTLMYAI
jgi:hypothetical protein